MKKTKHTLREALIRVFVFLTFPVFAYFYRREAIKKMYWDFCDFLNIGKE